MIDVDIDNLLLDTEVHSTPPGGAIIVALVGYLFISVAVAGALYAAFIRLVGVEVRVDRATIFCFTFFLTQYAHKAMASLTSIVFSAIRWPFAPDIYYVTSPIHTIHKWIAILLSMLAWLVILLKWLSK